MKKWMFIGLISVFAIIFLVSSFFLLRYVLESKHSADLYSGVADLVDTAEPETLPPTVPPTDSATEPGDEPIEPQPTVPLVVPELINVVNSDTGETVKVLKRYAEVFRKNPHTVGWIQIEGTQVNYPVMQTPDYTNYYLYRDFNRDNNNHGCIYAREQCDINKPSDNITIYGHWMRDGSMFGSLQQYKKQEYYEAHPIIIFDTMTERHTYQIIAVFRTSASVGKGFTYHRFVDAKNEAEFMEYVNTCKQLAMYETGHTAQYGDKLISLSTCEYSQTNGRLVIVAKRIT